MVTCPKRIDVMEEFDQISGMKDIAVWSEIARPVLDDPSCKKHLREVSRTDAYPRICLGILQKDVVTWLELLDQIVLQ